MGLPNFICIGAQKAGTTWLYRMLCQHPDLWLPPIKELHFFDGNATKPRARAGLRSKIAKEKRRYQLQHPSADAADTATYFEYLDTYATKDMLTEAWYRRIFDSPGAAGKITGEITPAYLDLKEHKLEYAVELLPKETKFIVLIREPRARALSQMRMTLEEKGVMPEEPQEWEFFIDFLSRNKRGNYLSSIPLWNKLAGKERILYLPFSDARERPRELLAQIEDFLGASHFDNYDAIDEQKNASKKIDIPDWVVEKVDEEAVLQRQFLIDTFGEAFVAKTA